MRRLRTITWCLFIGFGIVNAVFAGMLFARDKPILGAAMVIVAAMCVASAVLLHLFAAAYEDEIDRLTDVSDGLDKLSRAVEERRRRQDSGPDR